MEDDPSDLGILLLILIMLSLIAHRSLFGMGIYTLYSC